LTSEFLTDQKRHAHSEKTVALDVGLINLLATSEGHLIKNPKFLIASEDKLKKTQRLLSKKQKGGKNWQKTKIKIAKIHEKIKYQRKDFQHKISTELVKSFGIIVVENLSISNLLKNHYFSKRIGDASWNTLIRMLEYKAESAGTHFIKVNPHGTSQRCICGNKVSKNLKQREHFCAECGIREDRDVHASRVLLQKYRRNYGNSSLTEHSSRDVVTQEATPLSCSSSLQHDF